MHSLDTYSFLIGCMAVKADLSELKDGEIAPLVGTGEIMFKNVQSWDGQLNKMAVIYEETYGIDNKRNLYRPRPTYSEEGERKLGWVIVK
jgi:hypothetical protein